MEWLGLRKKQDIQKTELIAFKITILKFHLSLPKLSLLALNQRILQALLEHAF